VVRELCLRLIRVGANMGQDKINIVAVPPGHMSDQDPRTWPLARWQARVR